MQHCVQRSNAVCKMPDDGRTRVDFSSLGVPRGVFANGGTWKVVAVTVE